MSEFKVPKQAIEDVHSDATPPSTPEQPIEGFEVPGQVVSDLGRIAGNASSADTLLTDAPEETATEEPVPNDPITKRNRDLTNHNFSFKITGDTYRVFREMSDRKQRRAINMREKLIDKYGNRGLTEQSIGILCVNGIDRDLRGGGAVMFSGNERDYDEYYLVHMGVPLENRTLAGGKLEAEHSHIRYHGIKRSVINFREAPIDPMLLKSRLGISRREAANLCPRPGNNEWSPTVRVS